MKNGKTQELKRGRHDVALGTLSAIDNRQSTLAHSRGAGDGSDDLKGHIPFWMNLETISGCQRAILENWASVWMQGFQAWVQLAPTNLWQSILPGWNVSLFQVIREMKGNPDVESQIVKEVAGYGSQLGTLMDYLGVVSKHERISVKDLDAEDAAKYVRFQDLVEKVERIKKQA